jgi:hypothetical protein
MARPRILGTARIADEIADRLYERKNALGLSDAALDELCGFAAGHVSKLLGPARPKGLARFTLNTLADALGVSFLVVVDEEKVRRVGKRWEKRDGHCIHVRACRVSKVATAQVKAELYRNLGKLGGDARARYLSAEQRSHIARKAAHAMHRKRREMLDAA